MKSDMIPPMLLERAKDAFDSPDYIFEIKYDGIRIIADGRDEKYELYTRSFNPRTDMYEEIVRELYINFPPRCVFDGEVIAVDDEGKPDFYKLLRRGRRKTGSKKEQQIPVYYIIFDILYFNGDSVMTWPLIKRKELLDKIFGALSKDCAAFIKKSDVYLLNGKKLFDAAKAMNLEGITAKKADSPYLPGIRSAHWQKIKAVRYMDAFIGGYLLKSRISVCLGLKTDEGLEHIGNAGTGLDEKGFAKLKEYLGACLTDVNPFFNFEDKTAFFTEPVLKICVSYSEIEKTGKLRHPVIEKIYY